MCSRAAKDKECRKIGRHARAASLAQSRKIALGKVALTRSKVSVNSVPTFASFDLEEKMRTNIVVLRISKQCLVKSHRSFLIFSIRDLQLVEKLKLYSGPKISR